MGNGYTKQPIIGFSSAPAGGVTAVGVASITTNYIGCGGDTGGKIAAIDLINPGCGYTVPPLITIRDGGGTGAAATASIETTPGSGSISGIITVTDGGVGYTTNPRVTFDAPIPEYPTFDVTYNTFDQTNYTFDNNGSPTGFTLSLIHI